MNPIPYASFQSIILQPDVPVQREMASILQKPPFAFSVLKEPCVYFHYYHYFVFFLKLQQQLKVIKVPQRSSYTNRHRTQRSPECKNAKSEIL